MFNYNKLNEGFQFLMKPQTEFIAINIGRYFQTPKGLTLGIGPFVSALEYSTGRKARVVGKPMKSFFHEALAELGLKDLKENETVVMVGDDIRDDVGGAQGAGFKGVLVQTGKYMPHDESKFPQIKPDLVVESFPKFIDIILGTKSKL
jgi:HAD superfamily hydrolase (TIGR01458 family)